jgi:murein L,D-transpeptidase YcbB/YkuD
MATVRGFAVIALVCAVSGACAERNTHATDEITVARIVSAPSPPAFVGRDAVSARRWTATRQFYQKRGNEPAWLDGRRPRPQMDELIATLQHVDRDGLDPELYGTSALAQRRAEAGRGFLTAKGFDPDTAASLDVWLTYLYLQYVSDITNGVGNLSHVDPTWQIKPSRVDAATLLQSAIEQNRVAVSLEELLPHDPQYAGLRDALAKYRAIAQSGGWPTVPAGLKLKPGQHSAAVVPIAQRLVVTGDYSGPIDASDTGYRGELVDAVRRFERRHGLEPDGIVSASVAAEMNVPVERRIEQIQLNLERFRWLPRDLGDRYILVNIPEYRLEVWDHGQVPLAMKVVVGKKDTPTPIFDDEMTHLIFAPYWNVPDSIAESETLPNVMRDPSFLEKTNMEVLDRSGHVVDPATIDLSAPGAYRFRQRPGASNSLGSVKFMFPNQFNVYLHDTPADSLFARATRSFSHGCVRVEQPEALAEYVLRDQPEWTRERIESAMHASEETTVKLKSPLPVYLGYWTARVTPDGIVQFRKDIYGIDERQTGLLVKLLHIEAGSFRADDRNRPAWTAMRARQSAVSAHAVPRR